MVLSYTAWLSLRPAAEQPRRVASAAQVEPLANPGDRHRRPGSGLSGQAHLARLPFPDQLDLRRDQAGALVDEVAEGALQGQGFGGAGAGGRAEKLKLGKQSTLRSTATEDGLRRTGKRKSQGGGRGGQREFLALPIFLFLASLFLNAPAFRLPLSALRFQVSAFQRFSFLLRTQVSESSSVTARSSFLGFRWRIPLWIGRSMACPAFSALPFPLAFVS